jgi:SPP1 family predicted phage head-tail adaptor
MVRRTKGIGAMRDRITLEAPVQVTDDIGGQTATWSSKGTIFAYVKSVETNRTQIGGRDLRGGNIDYSTQIEITFALFDAVTIQRTWRVTWNGTIYTIKSLVKDDIDNLVYLICEKREV